MGLTMETPEASMDFEMTNSVNRSAVAVVVPVFNRIHLLDATVESLRSQSIQDIEFLLIDDRSESDVWDYLQQLPARDSRFRVIRKPDHIPRGCQCSRNIGLDETRSEFVVFLDSDDLLEPYCLETRLKFLQSRPNVDIAIGNQACFDERSGKSTWINRQYTNFDDLDRFVSLAGPLDVPWVNGGCMLRVESLKARRIRWRNEFHWDDAVFHLDCLMAGMRSEWMPRSETPDSWYRQHGGEHYGATLQTPEGRENTLKMFQWLFKTLEQSQKMTSERLACLKRSFFLSCVLPIVDLGTFTLAKQFCSKAAEWKLFSRSEMLRLHLFIRGRRFTKHLNRIRYYLNQFARRRLLREFFGTAISTYCSVPVGKNGSPCASSLSHFERIAKET